MLQKTFGCTAHSFLHASLFRTDESRNRVEASSFVMGALQKFIIAGNHDLRGGSESLKRRRAGKWSTLTGIFGQQSLKFIIDWGITD